MAGYGEIADQPVVSQHDSLLFINSGYAALRDNPDLIPSGRSGLFGIQTCVRMQGFEAVGNGTASTSFRLMGSWLFGGNTNDYALEAYQQAAQYLGAIGLSENKMSVSYFAGNSDIPMPADQITPAWWRENMPGAQIKPTSADQGIWGLSHGRHGLIGRKVDISYDFGGTVGEKEVWNVANFLDTYQDKNGVILPQAASMLDSGIGLDRTAAFMMGEPIQAVDQYKAALSDIQSTLPIAPVEKDSLIVLDHLKTATLLIRNGIVPGPKGREYVVRKLIRRTASVAIRQGLDYRQMIPLWNSIVADSTDGLPYTTLGMKEIQETINNELRLLEPIMKQCAKLSMAIENSTEFSATYLFKLHTSTGMPTEIMKDIYQRHGRIFPDGDFKYLLDQHQQQSRKRT